MTVELTLEEKVDAILDQTQKTNGRVTRLEEDVYGNAFFKTTGLVGELREIKTVVLDARAQIRMAKWLVPVGMSALTALSAFLAIHN